MLFDLRGRGRRRTVQVIYLTLALLLGGGLVLFGIGGDVQGGLFDAFRERQRRRDNDAIEEQRRGRAQKRVEREPARRRARGPRWPSAEYQLAGAERRASTEQHAATFTGDGPRAARGRPSARGSATSRSPATSPNAERRGADAQRASAAR